MINHTKLLLKGYKIANFPEGFEMLSSKLLFLTRKNLHGFSLVTREGKEVLPFGTYMLVAASENFLIIFNEKSLCMEGINLTSFQTVFKLRSYSDCDAEVVTVKSSDELETTFDYAIVLDSKKRYRVMDITGYERATGIISYEKYFDEYDKYFDEKYNCKMIALRYEDHFGLLTNSEIFDCDAIIDVNPEKFKEVSSKKVLYDIPSRKYVEVNPSRYSATTNCNTAGNKYLPLCIFQTSLGDGGAYLFVGSDAKIQSKYHLSLIVSHESNIYKVELKDKMGYLYFDNAGNVIGNETFAEATNFVSNRAFVRRWEEESKPSKYFTLMDEEGRMITNDDVKITFIKDNFKKRTYGSFMMTLAEVINDKNEALLIDKELHVYPSLPSFSK